MGLTIHMSLDHLSYGIDDAMLTVPVPGDDVVQVRAKRLHLKDEQSGISIVVTLPTDPPPDTSQVPPDYKPPAKAIGEGLLDNKPRIETATFIPPLNGGQDPRQRRR